MNGNPLPNLMAAADGHGEGRRRLFFCCRIGWVAITAGGMTERSRVHRGIGQQSLANLRKA